MKKAQKKILDVGCGDAKVKGAIGIDCVKLPGVDIVHDLNKYPWPFKKETFDDIYMLNIIEHLPNTVKVIEEVYRILKKGGRLHIEVVYWNHRYAVADPQHVSFFNEVTWEFFTGQRKEYYTGARFSMEKFEYIYDKKSSLLFLHCTPLMRVLSYFFSNIIQGMEVTLVKNVSSKD